MDIIRRKTKKSPEIKKPPRRLFLFFARKFGKRRYRWTAIVLILLLVLQIFYPILPLWSPFSQKVKANTDIEAAKDSEALFVNTNPDFKVEFGKKDDPTAQAVRFEAVPSDIAPLSEKKSSEVKPVSLESIKEKVRETIVGAEPKGIEFSLKEARLEGEIRAETKEEAAKAPTLSQSPPQAGGEDDGKPNPDQPLVDNETPTPPSGEAPDTSSQAGEENKSPSPYQGEGGGEVESLEQIEQKVSAEKQILENMKAELANMAADYNPETPEMQAKLAEAEKQIAEAKQVSTSTELQKEQGKEIIKNPDVIPGVTLRYEILGGKGVKEDIIINQLEGFNRNCLQSILDTNTSGTEGGMYCSVPRNSYVFDLTLDPGIEFHQAIGPLKNIPAGSYYFTNKKGKYLFHFLPLYAVDAAGGKTNAVRLEISPSPSQGEGGGEVRKTYQMKVVLDPNWLLDGARSFPVRIDPTILHDTEAEFNGGTALSRVESIAGPKVEIQNPSGGNDPYTKLLLHADGANASTTFLDSSNSLAGRKTVTANADSKILTDQSKFGGSSAYFDGTGDYLSAPGDTDFNFGAGDFTIDGWVRFDAADDTSNPIVDKYISGNGWIFRIIPSAGTNYMSLYWTGSGPVEVNSTPFAANNWYHVAVVRSGNAIKFFKDGVQQGTDQTAHSTYDGAATSLHIGQTESTGNMKGYIDELRISKGIARWTSGFTPPTRAYDGVKDYGVYTSPVVDSGGNSQTEWSNLTWTENGVRTGDGETPYSSTDLVAQWNFNETSGTTAANNAGAGTCGGTASNCDFTLNNFASTGSRDAAPMSGWTADNKRWGAGALMMASSGSGDYLSRADIAGNVLDPNSSDMTLDMWIKTNDISTGIIYNNNANETSCTNNGYYLGIDASGFPLFKLDTNGATAGCDADVTGTTKINDGQYHHLAVSVTRGTGATVYVDGKAAGTDASVTSYSGITVAGSIYAGGSAGFDGILDTMRFYSRALGADEILSDYQAGNIEFQTRSGSDATPDDGSWGAWAPSGTETQIASFDSGNASVISSTVETSDSSVPIAEGSGAMKISQGAPQTDASTVGLWHMEETGGSGAYVKDSSGNANDGTPTGTTSIDGINGKGKSFDDSDDYVEIGDHASLDLSANGTVEAWIKTNANEADNWFLCKNGNYCLGVNATGALLFTGASAQDNGGTSLLSGSWHHVAVTNNNTTATYYIDGAQAGTDSVAWGSTLTNALRIGRDGGSNYFDGLVDEVRISSSVRSAEEIAEAYRLGRDYRIDKTFSSADLSGKSKLPFYVAADRPGSYLEATVGESAFANHEPDASTAGLWHLDEQSGSGAYFKDSSTNANHGTPTGTTFSEGRIGKARSMNGTGDGINLGDPASGSLDFGTNSFTYSLWVKVPASAGAYDMPWYKGGAAAADAGYSMTLGTGVWQGNISDGSAIKQVTFGNEKLNQWVFLSAVVNRSSNLLLGYINGQLADSTDITGLGSVSNALNANIGRTDSYYFKGLIDEVRVDSTARTADEIRQAYEVGLRSHPITIDFAASLDGGNLIANSGDTSFTIDATTKGLAAKGSNLYVGDKIIVKENYDGTEYIAQGTVNAITESTGVATVASWDAASTFPASGFTASATVFKWQREFMDPGGSLSGHRDATTQLTLRATDGTEGRNIYIDDIGHVTSYLSDASGSPVSSGNNRYFQYRSIFSTTDTGNTPYLSTVSFDYVAPPTLDQIMRHGKYFMNGLKKAFWWAQ